MCVNINPGQGEEGNTALMSNPTQGPPSGEAWPRHRATAWNEAVGQPEGRAGVGRRRGDPACASGRAVLEDLVGAEVDRPIPAPWKGKFLQRRHKKNISSKSMPLERWEGVGKGSWGFRDSGQP